MVLVKVFLVRQKWTGRFDPQAEKARQKTRQQIIPLISYPLIFFLFNIPIFINRIQGLADPDNPEPALWLVSAATFPLEGAIIAMAFSLDPSTRRRMTLANFRAAIREFGKRKTVSEYPMEVTLEEDLIKKKTPDTNGENT